MEYTAISVRTSITSLLPAAIVVEHGGEKIALDGVGAEALRRIARMFTRAAEQIEDRGPSEDSHGASDFSLRYEFEWEGQTFPWPADRVDE